MMRFIRFILIVSTILFLAACGGSPSPSGENPGEQPNAGTLDEAAAKNFSGVALQSNDFMIGMLADPSKFSNPLGIFSLSSNAELSSAALQIAALEPQQLDCITEVGADIDVDRDGIPANSVVTFNCSESSEGFSYSYKGKMTFTDANDSDPKSGYSVKIEDYDLSFNTNGEVFKLSMNLDFTLSVTATAYSAKYKFDYDISGKDGSGKLNYDYAYTYTPDDLSDPFIAGTFVYTGSMSFTDNNETVQLNTSSPGVHFSESCKSGFDKGTVNYSDNAGNTIKIVFNACDNVTITYNGKPLSSS